MTTSTPITLPPSFFNSFWSPDYRTGLDVLFRQLEAVCYKGCKKGRADRQGVIENNEVAEFIEVS